MLLENNTKFVTRHLAKRSFGSNKMRNIFAVVAIVLTTVLFTGLFTVASSLLASMEESTMRQVGDNAHGAFKYLTTEQYDKVKIHPSIKEISYSVILGIGENKELAKRPTEIRYANDEIAAKAMFSMPTTGRLPQKEDELAADTIVLAHLGIPAELGQRVTLEYSVSGEKQMDTFTLVGFWQGDKLMKASQVWLDRGYIENQLVGYVQADENDFIGKINAEVNFANSFQIEDKLLNIIIDSGYTSDEIAYGVNWAYTGNSGSADMGTVLGGIGAILMVVLCGYLIISNVFYISVAKDTRFYGLLKAIGTTGRQIRFIIRRQTILLCLVGVPIGLLAGYFLGVLLTPIVLSVLNTNVIKISLSPIAFATSAIFAILTVIISISKPSKIAASISPIEALRSIDGAQKSKKTTKKIGGVNLWSMAQGNVFRNKKKAILVTVSLSLSLIILNCAYSIADSFDMDKYIRAFIDTDFSISDVATVNVHSGYTDQTTVSDAFLKELSAKSGIEQISSVYFVEPLTATDPRFADLPARVGKAMGISADEVSALDGNVKMEKSLQHIYGMGEGSLRKLTVLEGKIDFEKLKTGNYVIASAYEDEASVAYYNIGDKVKLASSDGTMKEYEVLAIAAIPRNLSIGHYHSIMPEFFLPSDVFLRDIAKKAPMFTTLDVADEAEPEMEAYLKDYCENVDPNMQYTSKATLVAEYESTQRTYQSVGLILSLLIAFIGIMNFINTVVTSIMSRRREFAMLQSIAMTARQTQTMLICEGLVYTVLTAVFVLTVGSVLGYFAVKAFTTGGTYLSLHFTVLPSLLCLPVLAVISALAPYISERMMNRGSIVERLREAE